MTSVRIAFEMMPLSTNAKIAFHIPAASGSFSKIKINEIIIKNSPETNFIAKNVHIIILRGLFISAVDCY